MNNVFITYVSVSSLHAVHAVVSVPAWEVIIDVNTVVQQELSLTGIAHGDIHYCYNRDNLLTV
jgi:hypothetical protein